MLWNCLWNPEDKCQPRGRQHLRLGSGNDRDGGWWGQPLAVQLFLGFSLLPAEALAIHIQEERNGSWDYTWHHAVMKGKVFKSRLSRTPALWPFPVYLCDCLLTTVGRTGDDILTTYSLTHNTMKHCVTIQTHSFRPQLKNPKNKKQPNLNQDTFC